MTSSTLPSPAAAAPPGAEWNEGLLSLWLHGRPDTTQRAYRADARRFLALVDRPLYAVALADVQRFADSLSALAAATRVRRLAAVKSLLAFGHHSGVLSLDVGRAVRLPALKNRLSERILPEASIHKMLALEADARNHALLRLSYAAALRVSELCGLRWRDLAERESGGQITVYGKGGATRFIVLQPSVWEELQQLRPARVGLDDPVFRSRKRGALSTRQAWAIVKAAALRAGLSPAISPHWLRHAHASHALYRGAPISLVQQTLGHASIATTGKYLHARPAESSGDYLAV